MTKKEKKLKLKEGIDYFVVNGIMYDMETSEPFQLCGNKKIPIRVERLVEKYSGERYEYKQDRWFDDWTKNQIS